MWKDDLWEPLTMSGFRVGEMAFPDPLELRCDGCISYQITLLLVSLEKGSKYYH